MRFRRVLVTGASSGIGRGLALHYARVGATVHALARRAEALQSLAAEANGPGALGRVIPVPVDVTDAGAQVAAVEAAQADAGGALDLVIANAGVSRPTPGAKIDWRSVQQVLEVNATAACVTVAAALPAMVARGQGTVAGVASLAGFRGMPGFGAYSASKAALHTFLESLRVDLRGTGVKVVEIAPGFVKTDMTAGARYPMPFLMELDAGVARIARGIERAEPVVAFPFPLSAIVRVVRTLPRWLYEPLAARLR